MMEKILLLEDDQSFGYILSEYLRMHDFDVDWVKSGEEALKMLNKNIYSIAILDIMLPGIDGFELAAKMKRDFEETPFIFVSAKSLKIDKLKGYKLGAYDYITKPVDEELLVAKIRALIRQTKIVDPVKNEYAIGDYSFVPSLFQLKFNDDIIKLTSRETKLLTLLCEHKNSLLSRKKALSEIWGSNDEFNRKSMDVFISRLRKYLAKDPAITLENVHGEGFILYG